MGRLGRLISLCRFGIVGFEYLGGVFGKMCVEILFGDDKDVILFC